MHGVVFHPINMKNEQNITGSNTLTEDTPAPADSTPNTPGGTKTAKKMTRTPKSKTPSPTRQRSKVKTTHLGPQTPPSSPG